jgi:hypothetical protein
LLLNFAVDYAIGRGGGKGGFQANQDVLKLNDKHQFFVYTDDVNILGGGVHTIKENAEALLVGSKEIGLKVNVGKTRYMVLSRDRNSGRSHKLKFDNSSFERMEEFK